MIRKHLNITALTQRTWLIPLISIFIVFCASVLRMAFFSRLGRGIPYLTYYPAVMIAAIIGGLPAGLLVTFISAILAYAWIQKGQMTSIEWLAMAFFVVICIMISLLAEAKRRANKKVLRIKQNLEKLIQERTQELQKSEQHFRNLMEQSPLAMAIYTPDGRLADVNPAFYRQWGFSREEATEVFAKYNQRTDKQLEDIGVAPLVEKAYAGEAVVLPPMEYIGSRACEEFGVEGAEVRTRWIQIHLYPIKDENGSVAYVVNTNLDITESKLAQEEFMRSERRFRSLVENANEAIVVAQDKTVKYGNPQVSKLTGYSPEELSSGDFVEFIHPEDREIVLGKYQDRLSGERPTSSYSIRIITKDGEERHVFVNSALIDWDSRPATLAMLTDITERKKAQENITRQAKLLDLIFQNSLDSIVLLDKDYNFIWVSNTYAKSCQRDPSEFAGHNHFEFYPSNLKEEFDAAKKGKSIYRKYARPFIFPDHPEWGETYWDLGLVPIFDDDGEIEKFLFTLKDVTERKKSERSIREAEKRYCTVADFTYDWEYWENPDRTFSYISPSCERHTGYKVEEFKDNPTLLTEIILDEDRGIWKQHCSEVLEEPGLLEIQFRIRKKDGEIRWFEHACQPVEDKDGVFLGFRASNRDITLRKEAEEVIKKSQDSLRFLAGKLITAQEEERRRLAREMHDDLTQRLALLAIEAGKLEIESKKYDSTMHANLQDMKKKIIKLSKDIHDISRQIHPSILDDLGLVNAIKSECAAFTQREGIHVEYEANNVPSSIPRSIKICIYRIIQESLRNIAKHAGTDKAYVSLTCSDGSLFLTVRDNGVGFDTLQMQGQKGIGLTSIEERIRLIQGEFSVQSEPGEGTVIKVTAPLSRSRNE